MHLQTSLAMPASVFTIANQKGGVGKTTTAVNLCAALADRGSRTLLIDLDSQANATSGLGFEKEKGASLLPVFRGDGKATEQIIETGIRNLSLIPSEIDLAVLELELSGTRDYLLQLRKHLSGVFRSNRFDAVIIDCPPALGLVSMNALTAADQMIIPLQCEYLALEGLGQIMNVMYRIRESGANQNLELGGIIMTMFDVRTNLSRQVDEDVRRHFGEVVFETVIPRSVRLGESPSFGATIFQYDPNSAGAQAYRMLAREFARRFGLK
jgi:chromosome partitioning protein